MMNPTRVVASIEQLEPRRLLASVLPGFADETVVPIINRATSMAFAPDGRLFVTIQDGDVRVVKNDQLLAAPFMTLPVDAVSERGVLGLTFDPDFSTNQFVYVYYTVPDTGTGTVRNRLSRFTALGDVVRAGSERILNTFPTLTAGNHNGGAIHFGEDGKLYVAIGDGGNTPTKAQDINSPRGKILRFNTDGSAPVDNPFYSNNGRKDYHDFVWAFGLRNPFTFDIQPGTGKMFINDVGQNTWEEINLGARGANYGWPNSEGPDNTGGFIAPTFFYGHGIGPATGFAITGGVFYNPATAQFPAGYTGDYFYADFVSGWIRTLDAQTNTSSPFADGITSPVDLDIGPDGSLYYLDRGRPGQQIDGRIGRISNLPTAPARVTTDPLDVSVSPGQPATFSVEVTGASPFRFQWQRNNVDIFNANQRSYTLNNVQAGASGDTFRGIVTNDFGTDTSTPATLTVVSNTAPVAKITKPVAGAT